MTRLDDFLVEKGICLSLKEAQAQIMMGNVLADDRKIMKAGTAVKEGTHIRLLNQKSKFVGRGGEKLEGALETFGIDIPDVCMDIGLSTGGFTDCLKQRGAKAVFGVDVSYGLLDYKIRQWDGLKLLERTNARTLTREQLLKVADVDVVDRIGLVVMDVSFISVTKITPTLLKLVQPGTAFVILIKPQFEADPDEIEDGGLVTDAALQEAIVSRVRHMLEKEGLNTIASCPSVIKGTKGNQEYFLFLRSE